MNADVILHTIEHSDGVTDAELVKRTVIQPHQQVNQVCRWLAGRGRIVREVRCERQIVNSAPLSREPLTPRELAVSHGESPVAGHRADDAVDGSVSHMDPTTTLLVIPYSAARIRVPLPTEGAGY